MAIWTELALKAKDFWQSNSVSAADIIWAILSIALILVVAILVNKAVSAVARAVLRRKKKEGRPGQEKRFDSLLTLTHSMSRYTIYLVAIAMILSVLGLGQSVGALIATAGIGGLAIGFGAQNLVRDVVTGLFLMFENQYAVGDYISAGDAEGSVEAVAVRVTYLRGLMGEQYIIPNGTIGKVINYTRGDYTALVDVCIAYHEDVTRAMELMQRAADEYAAANASLVTAAPKVAGVASLDERGVTIRTFCAVVPLKQYEVERGLRLCFKNALERGGVEIPYPHCVVIRARESDAGTI